MNKTVNNLLTICLGAVFSAGLTTETWAGDLSNFSTINQSEFLSLSKDLAAATSSKPSEPAAPMGMSGFDISGSVSVTETQSSSAWTKVTGSSTPHLPIAKLYATKGLPWDIDVGVFTATLPTTNLTASGIHAKYALISGNTVLPALAARVGYSRIGGGAQMDLSNTSYDLLISKGFLGITPYAGVGIVKSSAKLKGVSGLNSENFNQQKTFAGVSWNMLLLNISAEYDRTGQISSYSIKTGLRF
jgi:hypothetical protein